MNKYAIYENPHKDILDTIHVGDLVKCNDWGNALRVVAVSPNFFIMKRNMFGTYLYSICHKQDADFGWTNIDLGTPFIGPDDRVFHEDYSKEEDYRRILDALEQEKLGVSLRHGVSLHHLEVKRSKPLVRIGRCQAETVENFIQDNPEFIQKVVEKSFQTQTATVKPIDQNSLTLSK